MAVVAPGSSGGGGGGGDDWRDDDWGRGKKGGWSDWWTHPKPEEEEEEDSEQGDGSWWSSKGWSWENKRKDNKGAVQSRMKRHLRRKHQTLLNQARVRLGEPVSGRSLSEQIAFEAYVRAHAEMSQLAQMQALAEHASGQRRNLFPVEERAYSAMFQFVYGQGPPVLAGKVGAGPSPKGEYCMAYTAAPVPAAPVAPVAPPADGPVRFTVPPGGLIVKQKGAPARVPEPAKPPSFMSQLAAGPLQPQPGKAAAPAPVMVLKNKAASGQPHPLKTAGPPLFPKGTLSYCVPGHPHGPKPKAASPNLTTFHALIDLQKPTAKEDSSSIAALAPGGGSSSSSSAKAVGSAATPDVPVPKSLTPNIMSKAEMEKLKAKNET